MWKNVNIVQNVETVQKVNTVDTRYTGGANNGETRYTGDFLGDDNQNGFYEANLNMNNGEVTFFDECE